MSTETKTCIRCGTALTKQQKRGKYCGHSCAASHTNLGRIPSLQQRQKVRLKLSKDNSVVRQCKKCQTDFTVERASKIRRYCSQKCAYSCPENRAKISQTTVGKTGGLRPRGTKHGSWYQTISGEKVWLDSTWEVALAKYLDEKGIKWTRNAKSFPYTDENGRQRRYYPDFYLTEKNEYWEVKGFIQERDLCKWKNFPEPLVVLTKDKLNILLLEIGIQV